MLDSMANLDDLAQKEMIRIGCIRGITYSIRNAVFRKALRASLIAGLALINSGCGGDGDDGEDDDLVLTNRTDSVLTDSHYTTPTNSYPTIVIPPIYPSASEKIYFSPSRTGVGRLSLNMDDAYELINDPDFSLYNGHGGGYGDTLQIVSNNRGMYFYWSYNSLNQIAFFDGFTGKIEGSGIGVGDTLEKFLSRYPKARNQDKSWRVGNGGSGSDEAFLTADIEDGKIKRLRLDTYDADSFSVYNGP
jgi:hypothetical protein